MRTWSLLICLGGLSLGCTEGLFGKDDPDPDTDTDTDTDVRIEIDLDCTSGAYATPAPGASGDGDCITEPIPCNSSIEGTTIGGSTVYDLPHWTEAQCADWLLNEPDDTLDAAERVYSFELVANQLAEITLESPCAELELRVVDSTAVCSDDHSNCTVGTDLQGWDIQQVSGLSGGPAGNRFEIVVDGYNGAEGNFRVTLACSE